MANYTETFSGQTTGANSTTFTNRWATETSISVENPAIDEQDDRVLRFSTGDSGYQLQSMDSVDSDANRDNCEILTRVRVNGDDDNLVYLIGRGSGAATTEAGYVLLVSSNGTLRIYRVSAGAFTLLGGSGPDVDTRGQSAWANFFGDTFNFMPPDKWLLMRFRINGTGATVTLSGKIWADGQEEPTDWDMVRTDTSASRITTAGWCGVGRGVHTFTTYLDAIGIGTNGDTAALPAGTSPVRVSAASAQVLQQNEATPVRVTNASAQVLHQYDSNDWLLTVARLTQ
jgi:hypothetical protein